MNGPSYSRINYAKLHLENYLKIYKSIEDPEKRQAYIERKLGEEYISYQHSLYYALHCGRRTSAMDFEMFKCNYMRKFLTALDRDQRQQEKELRAEKILERKMERIEKKKAVDAEKAQRKEAKEEARKKRTEEKANKPHRVRSPPMTYEELKLKRAAYMRSYREKKKAEWLASFRNVIE